MKFFTACKSVEELKKVYFKLAMKNHPDKGGDPEIMKAVNNEYDTAFEMLKDIHTSIKDTGEPYYKAKTPTTEAPADFKGIIDALLRMQGLDVELCGRWVWIYGDTKPSKDNLLAMGCRWHPKKEGKPWSWHYPEDKVRGYKGRKSWNMQKIRDTFGSQSFEKSEQQKMLGA